MSEHHPTAFVLSGGASLGAIQVGMLRALYEREIIPDFLVGASAGALNAAFIASRPPTVQTCLELGRLWRGLRRSQVFPLDPLTGLRALRGGCNHLVPDWGLRRLASRYVQRERLEDMPIPLYVVAVDVLTGEELRLTAGPAVEAVMASAAIPAVLPPVRWLDRDLVDGGVANNTPISHAVELGAATIYVLPSGHACALHVPPRGALALGLHALTLLMHRRLMDDIERYRGRIELIVLPPPCPLAVGPLEFGRAPELMSRAYADACAFLDGGGAQRPPIRMVLHRHTPTAPLECLPDDIHPRP